MQFHVWLLAQDNIFLFCLIGALVFTLVFTRRKRTRRLYPRVYLIGLVAPHSCGKTEVERYLERRYHFASYRLADPLKEIAMSQYKFTTEQVMGKLKDSIDVRYGCTPRDKIHEISDIAHRINPDFLLKKASLWLSTINAKPCVISDCRLPQQIDFVHQNGGILIYLRRCVREEQQTKETKETKETKQKEIHDTERIYSPRHSMRSYIVENNESLESLFLKIDAVIRLTQSIPAC
jgi:dephospho-CoA kinase